MNLQYKSLRYFTIAKTAQSHTSFLNYKKNAPSQKEFIPSHREKNKAKTQNCTCHAVQNISHMHV